MLHNTKISLIAAMDQKRGIGKNNKLLFRIPEDMRRFRELTTGHPVIMGRKTFESIGRPLPNRTNIVMTRDTAYVVEGAIIAHSLEEAIEKAKHVILNEVKNPSRMRDLKQVERSFASAQDDNREKEIFVIGGGQMYAQALPLANKLYLTIVEGEYGADTFFPEYGDKRFHVVREEKGESEGYKYTFLELER